ncbi:HigA family addiction module antitoxin [Methylobacterium sp. E-045]|uniref:HigA family addiction module antitoxin n=1 Tax=Methylobacterium sp. E-045 TaxID=2836575 RepID=UPI001FB886FA|nr:HigA family addiction module antitoxin [Methylobacterium sp. E-045]MCJ2129282.1 HigA family addiction module antitoxin [Methylobacterium sp. E-045]
MSRIFTHPGNVLAEDYLAPLGLSARQVAAEIGVPPNRLSEIIRERRGVSADTAIRLGVRFGTSAQFWLNLQNAHDLSKARATMDDSAIRSCEPRTVPAP